MKNPLCGRLKNNWKYVVESNKCGKTVTVLVVFKVGSINELPKEAGMSHFIEHLFFQGTKNKLKSSKDITQAIYKNGGYVNAFTSYDYTGYYIKIDSHYLEGAMEILSEILFQSKFSPVDLEREKKIVIQENDKHESEPMRILHDLSYRSLYKGTPLENPIGGYEKTIKKFNRKMLLDYLDKNYTNAVVSVSGRISDSEKKVLSMLEKYFGQKFSYQNKKGISKKDKHPLKLKSKLKKHAIPKFSVVKRDFQETYVAVSFLAGALSLPNEDKVSADLLGVILAGNMSSRLFMKLREKHQYVYSIIYQLNHYEIGGELSIQAGTQAEHLRPVIKEIMDEIKNVKNGGITKEELRSAIDYKVGELTLLTEDSKEVALHNAYYYLFLDKCWSIDDLIKEYQKITPKKINEVAQKIFDFKKVTVSIVSDSNK